MLLASHLGDGLVSGCRVQMEPMITLGVILLIIGLVAAIPILWTIGIVLVVIGLILAILGTMGRAVGGRNHYW